MNINSLNTNQISQLTSTTLDAVPATSATTGATTSESTAAHSSMSGPGQLMSKLTQLKQSDPAKFKEVVSKMAASLKEAAAQHSGKASDRLNQLASKLDDVANGGDIAQLQPSGPPPGGPHGAGGHHGHHGAHRAHGDSAAPSADSSTPADGITPADGSAPAADAASESADAAHKYSDNAASAEHDFFRQTIESALGQLDLQSP